MHRQLIDVIIIGGSYAGLAAALTLGRSMRQVLVIDDNNSCNRSSAHSHNFLTRDGESPEALRIVAREQVIHYPTVSLMYDKVVRAVGTSGAFEIETQHNGLFTAKKLLFATGMRDVPPEIEGFSDCWGNTILHCPYCHGYEAKNTLTGILSNGDPAFELAKTLTNWTKDLILFTNGPSELSREQTDKLLDLGVEFVEEKVMAIAHETGSLKQVVTTDGVTHPAAVLYVTSISEQQSDLPVALGCELTDHGLIWIDSSQKTTVEGVYAAGDNSSMARVIALAAAAGATAGMCINKELTEEGLG